MKTLFYPKLAWDGIRKNRRLVFPYMLTCICMISMFYILLFLGSPSTGEMLPRGGTTAMQVMILGSFVIAVFSVIFLYYTNSFLIRRRAGEFGLYNVLGMGKRNLAKIITFETLITSGISIVVGIFVGIVISKLAELGLVKMLGGQISYNIRIEWKCVYITVLFYLVIFAVIWFSSIIRVGVSSAVSLLKSEKAGEKAPKANWLLGLGGAVILAIAYYKAVSIVSPLDAIMVFFVAVIMVIIATYLLMIAGSVLLCRILQKNKKYYYNPKHFVSVSSLVYRMKRNGAGLASIAIIATMVLVMISTASCMWFGSQDMIDDRYPADINFVFRFDKSELMTEENMAYLRQAFEDYRAENDSTTTTVIDLPYMEMSGSEEDNNTINFDKSDIDAFNVSSMREVCFIPLQTYNEATNQNIALDDGEALVFSSKGAKEYDTINLTVDGRSRTYKCVNPGTEEIFSDYYLGNIIPMISVVVSDYSDTMKFFEASANDRWYNMFTWKYSFDLNDSSMTAAEYAKGLKEAVWNAVEEKSELSENCWYYYEEREYEALEYVALNGSVFFIGIVLSIVFILAAVLIIYYKQISEGYEDAGRFEVMKKVGMSKKEIKRSINSQLLVVFFIPLVFAGLHLAFAFPMISKILNLFGLFNTGLFMMTTVICFIAFAIFYAVVYKVTSNVYYNIVTDAK